MVSMLKGPTTIQKGSRTSNIPRAEAFFVLKEVLISPYALKKNEYFSSVYRLLSFPYNTVWRCLTVSAVHKAV